MKVPRRSFTFTVGCLILAASASPAIARPAIESTAESAAQPSSRPAGQSTPQREPTELINRQHCMFCHTVDKPFLAPSFHQIAGRYRNEPHAAGILARKLRVGGRAHWGDTPMPPPSERGGPLSAKEAHTLVNWVLSQ